MKNVHSPIDNALSSRHSLLAVPLLLARQRKFRYVQTQIGGTTMAAKKKTAAKKPVKKAVKKAAPKKVAAKKPAKKAAAKKPAKKAAPKKKASGAKRKPNAAFMKPMTPSASLAAVIGSTPVPRTEVTKKLWAYIKKNDLQDSKNRRNINADDKLKEVFGGKKTVSMFEMTKLVAGHLK
jgi:upstream activation factor subunit UAF30